MVPCQRRGNQTKGTMIVRPSTRSTVKASRDTFADCARASAVSIAKELMPPPQELLTMLVHELNNGIQFRATEAPGPLKGNWFQTEFRGHIIASHVNVRRLAPIQGHKEKTI